MIAPICPDLSFQTRNSSDMPSVLMVRVLSQHPNIEIEDHEVSSERIDRPMCYQVGLGQYTDQETSKYWVDVGDEVRGSE